MIDAFWIDDEDDRASASDGVSRYGHYVRDRMEAFAEAWNGTWDNGTVPFACTAWRTATGPVMAPGYVRRHRRILSASVIRNDWDGSLGAAVSVITPWPAALASARDWRRGQWWRDWPTEHLGFSGETFYEPTGQEVAANPYLTASAEMAFSLPSARLPLPVASWAKRGVTEETARQVVAILVAELNQVVSPVIEVLEGS